MVGSLGRCSPSAWSRSASSAWARSRSPSTRYGPVTDNAQSVYELSLIENVPNIKAEIKKDFGFEPELREGQALPRGERRRRQHLQGDRQAGADRHRGRRRDDDDLLDHHASLDQRPRRTRRCDEALAAPRRRSCSASITGGAMIYWFTGASMQAVVDRRLPRGRVHQGEHQARGRREGVGRGLQEGRRDLHAVRAEGHVQHLPRGLLRHARLRVASSRSSSSAT